MEPEDRKVPISIGLSTKSWKRIDKFMHENGGINRSQFFETISKWYIDEREKSQNPDEKRALTARQINNYFEDLE
jgi:metal-responsive CopG/Arc/MetJ family transcriptional regulator